MDKSPFQNEGVSSVEPKKTEVDHAIIVETKTMDTSSLPQKKPLSDSSLDLNSKLDLEKENPPVDEQPIDENWLLLSQDWQAQPYAKTDIQALLKQTKRRTLMAKLLLGLNLIFTVGLIVTLIIGLYQGDWGTATIAYLSFGCIASLVFVYYEIKIRLRIWQQACDSPDKAITNAIAGIESSIIYIKLTKLSFWILLPAVNWYILAMFEESEKSFWPPLFIINSFVIIGWLITHWFHLKRQKELMKLSSL
jgi:hypothetical protein